MKRLWAPWRMKYITSPPGDECFLCKAWESGDMKEHYVLARGEQAFVIMNLHPYNNGHLMVASAEHRGDPDRVSPAVRAEIMELVNYSVRVLKEAVSPHGFNIGLNLGQVAGAGVSDHLHVHIVPRWSGDTNFMPILSDVKVISEHIEDTYLKLKKIFDMSNDLKDPSDEGL